MNRFRVFPPKRGVIQISVLAGLIALAMVAIGVPAAVADPPGNDNFENAVPLSGTSFNVVGTNVEATAQPGEPNHAGFSLSSNDCFLGFDPSCQTSVWYAWTAPSSGPIGVQTCDSDYDTTLAAYVGNAVGSLTEVGSNDDGVVTCGGGGGGSAVAFNAAGGTTYRIAVAGYIGATGNINMATFTPPVSGGTPTVSVPTVALTPPATSSQEPKKKHKKHKKKHHKHKNKNKSDKN